MYSTLTPEANPSAPAQDFTPSAPMEDLPMQNGMHPVVNHPYSQMQPYQQPYMTNHPQHFHAPQNSMQMQTAGPYSPQPPYGAQPNMTPRSVPHSSSMPTSGFQNHLHQQPIRQQSMLPHQPQHVHQHSMQMQQPMQTMPQHMPLYPSPHQQQVHMPVQHQQPMHMPIQQQEQTAQPIQNIEQQSNEKKGGTVRGGFMASLKNVVNSVLGAGTLTILFDKQMFFTGHEVSGKIELNVTEKIKAKTVMIKVRAYERAKKEHSNDGVRTFNIGESVPSVTGITTNNELYSREFPIHNFGSTVIEPGKYTYDFKHALPSNLPGIFARKSASFFGAISFAVEARVDMQGKDITAKSKFTCMEHVTRVPQPISLFQEKTFLMGGSSPLRARITIDRDIYYIGERILLHCDIQNDSKKDVKCIQVRLIQDISMRNNAEEMKEVLTLHAVDHPGINSRCSFRGDVYIDLPSGVYPSTVGSVIKNQYRLMFVCRVNNAKNLKIDGRITLVQPKPF